MVNLPFLQKKDEVKKYFLTLLLKPHRVGAILFEEINSKLFIVSTKEEDQEGAVNFLSGEELVKASDAVVSYVESSIPENHTLEKTIFSIPYDWVEDGKIKAEFLAKLKKVCTDLGFKPEGFIVSIEAIVKFLQEKEGVPVSSIFVEVAKDLVFVYVVKAGRIVEVRTGQVEKGVVQTVESLLLDIHELDVLPSKLVLLDYDGAENIQQEFISYSWSKEIPFLHVPQVVVLEKGFENEAIVNGVALELGTEVLSDIKAGEDTEVSGESIVPEISNDEFGFLREEDLGKIRKEEEALVPVQDNFLDDIQKEEAVYVSSDSKPSIKNKVLSLFSMISPNITRQLKKYTPEFIMGSIKKLPVRGSILGAIVVMVIVAFLVSMLYYNFILFANVTVFADQKIFDKTATIDFVPGGNTTDSSLQISTTAESVSGEKNKSATGKKETGEKAKGEVTIYNRTEDSKTFPKGTVILGTNNLEFITLDSVTIASTSLFSLTPSNTKVKIEASTFGKEYNLPSATNFTIKGFPVASFFAKNDSAFSGGTKKETTVVSEKDIDELEASLIADLEKKAIAAARAKNPDVEFLTVNLSYEFIDRTVSRKAGEEAASVSVDGNVKFNLGYYEKSEIEILTRFLGDDVPENYSLNFDSSKFEFKEIVAGKNDTAQGKLSMHAVFVPKLETESLSKNISGKSKSSAEKIIQDISGVSDVNIVIKNKIPFLPDLLPKNPKNIKIEITI
jgi:hypothetical protein